MCGAHRHLYLVPPPDDVPLAPPQVQLPETIAFFMSQQPRALVAWLTHGPGAIPAQVRRMGGDLYLSDLTHSEREAVAERFMLCVELARQFDVYRGSSFNDEARLTFTLLSTTVAERAWLESSATPEAEAMREMQAAIAQSTKVDEALLQRYADAMHEARDARLMDLGITFREALDRLPRR